MFSSLGGFQRDPDTVAVSARKASHDNSVIHSLCLPAITEHRIYFLPDDHKMVR